MTTPTTRGRDRRPVEQRQTERHLDHAAEIRQGLEAANAYTATHGSFTELVRQHCRDTGGD